MSRFVNIALFGVLTLALVSVRMYEDSLFYDPLIQFFKLDHTTAALPSFELGKLLLHTSFRFAINTLLSLTILWVAFKSGEVVQLAAILYFIAFLVLMSLLWYLLLHSQAGNHMALFYVRRFLIQPLFLLVLLPAFYFKRG